MIVQCSVQAAPPGAPHRSEDKRRSRVWRIVLAVILLLSLIAAILFALGKGRTYKGRNGGQEKTNIVVCVDTTPTGSVVTAGGSPPPAPPPPTNSTGQLGRATNEPPVATGQTSSPPVVAVPPAPPKPPPPPPRVVQVIQVECSKKSPDGKMRLVEVKMGNMAQTSLDVSKLRVLARVFNQLDGVKVDEKTIRVNPPWRAGETNIPSVHVAPCPTSGYCEVEVFYDGHSQGSSRYNW